MHRIQPFMTRRAARVVAAALALASGIAAAGAISINGILPPTN